MVVGPLLAHAFDASTHPAKAAVLDHLDGFGQRLASIGKGRYDADTVEKRRRRDGLCGDGRSRFGFES